jgi:hypothetical protein
LGSCSASMCGMPSFSTAQVPPATATGATQRNSRPRRRTARRPSVTIGASRSRSATGNRSSHAARSGILRQLAASRPGTFNAIPPFWSFQWLRSRPCRSSGGCGPGRRSIKSETAGRKRKSSNLGSPEIASALAGILRPGRIHFPQRRFEAKGPNAKLPDYRRDSF